jgi:hypothetical protein
MSLALLDVSVHDGCPRCGGAVGACTVEEPDTERRTEQLRCLDDRCGWALTHDVTEIAPDQLRQ